MTALPTPSFLLERALPTQYMTVSSLCLFVYDYIITFDKEVGILSSAINRLMPFLPGPAFLEARPTTFPNTVLCGTYLFIRSPI